MANLEVFSWEFLLIFMGIVFFVMLKNRKKRVTPVLTGKRISIRGKKLVTPLSYETPLECLLADNINFGEDFKVKEEPTLPHNEHCRCELISLNLDTQEWFQEKPEKSGSQIDLEHLTAPDRRYFKYMLIASHPDASQDLKDRYEELIKGIEVDPKVQDKVAEHIRRRSL